MPVFTSPTDPPHRYNPVTEKRRIGRHFTARGVPRSTADRLLLASCNIANLGAQKRPPEALEVIAHMLKRFDLIALQELRDDFTNLLTILDHMGSGFDFIMNDTAGNSERLAFLYRTSKVALLNLFGELALNKNQYFKKTVTVRYRQGGQERTQTFQDVEFVPFDRNPYIGTFTSGAIDFTLVNVHLYFGKFGNSTSEADRRKYARRVVEIYAMSKWADHRFEKDTTYDRDIILLGDMNVPAMDPSNAAYRALTRFGWQPVRPLIRYLVRAVGRLVRSGRRWRLDFAQVMLF